MTLAGDNIQDSPVDPVELTLIANSPVIAIFSDMTHFIGDSSSMQMGAAVESSHTLDLTFSMFLPTEAQLNVDGLQTLTLESRESGAAFAFDIIGRQIEFALNLNTNTNVWAGLWARCVNKILGFTTNAYVLTIDKGTRVPSREITFHLDIIDEPGFGSLASDFWPDFIEAMAASDDLAPLAPVVQALLTGVNVPDWRAVQALMGLTRDEVANIGNGPLDGSGTLPEVTQVGGSVYEVGEDGAVNPEGSVTVTQEDGP